MGGTPCHGAYQSLLREYCICRSLRDKTTETIEDTKYMCWYIHHIQQQQLLVLDIN